MFCGRGQNHFTIAHTARRRDRQTRYRISFIIGGAAIASARDPGKGLFPHFSSIASKEINFVERGATWISENFPAALPSRARLPLSAECCVRGRARPARSRLRWTLVPAGSFGRSQG